MEVAKLIVSLLLPLTAGFLGSRVTVGEIAGWYRGLNKPVLVPPEGIFGPVWTILFMLMGISWYLIWVGKKPEKKKTAWILFLAQLGLNWLWSLLFFSLHSPALALAEIVILWLVILANIIYFYRYSKAAAWLLLPYLLWVAFAAYLTYGVWRLN